MDLKELWLEDNRDGSMENSSSRSKSCRVAVMHTPFWKDQSSQSAPGLGHTPNGLEVSDALEDITRSPASEEDARSRRAASLATNPFFDEDDAKSLHEETETSASKDPPSHDSYRKRCSDSRDRNYDNEILEVLRATVRERDFLRNKLPQRSASAEQITPGLSPATKRRRTRQRELTDEDRRYLEIWIWSAYESVF